MSPQTSTFESQWKWHLQDPSGSWCKKQLLKGSMNLVTLLGPDTGTEAEKGPDFLWKRLVYLKASAWGAGFSFNILWGLGGWQEPSLPSLPHFSWTVSPRKELGYLSGAPIFAVAAQRQLLVTWLLWPVRLTPVGPVFTAVLFGIVKTWKQA